MHVKVLTLDNVEAGELELQDGVFGLEPRGDLLHRIVLWQLAKRRAGTHKVLTRGETNRTKAKAYKQKGTGRARHGARTANIFRGGGVVFGPHPRDHGFDIPKKVRKLGLKVALSSKAASGKLMIIDDAVMAEGKTKLFAGHLKALGLNSALFVTGAEIDNNFLLASRNIPLVQVLPEQGANVYDILRRDHLVLTRSAVKALEERLA